MNKQYRRKGKKDMAYTDFLSERKRMLNEIAEENMIYEESQTGPQEEPTLQEIVLDLQIQKNRRG